MCFSLAVEYGVVTALLMMMAGMKVALVDYEEAFRREGLRQLVLDRLPDGHLQPHFPNMPHPSQRQQVRIASTRFSG
jgi:hypothetical protein